MVRSRLVQIAFVSLLGAAAVSGVACSVGPDFKPPAATVADRWRTGADPRVSAQAAVDAVWWKSFNDPALDRLVAVAYGQNLPLQIAGLRILEARAQMAVATGRQFPQVQSVFGSATLNRLSQNSVVAQALPAGTTLPKNFGDFQLGFDAAWELDFWGKYRRGVEAEAANLLASVADYYASVVSLTAEVARTYVNLRTFEVLIDQAEANARIQEESLGIAEARFKNGATSELDATQAASQLESTRATVPELRAGLEQARNALATLLGQPAGTVDAYLGGPKQIPNAPEKVGIGVPADMLRRRPDIRTAELLAAAQCARIGVAKSELYPSFTLLGSIGLETTASHAGTKSLFSQRSLFYTVGPRINWPFFTYGRLTNGVRVEDARFQQLLVSYRDTVLKAAQEVEDALVGFVNAQEAAVHETRSVSSAHRSVEISLVQYREGATDFQRVLDAQRSLLQEQNRLAQSTSSVATNVIALYKALGGGWEARQGQPIVPEQMQREMKERTNWGDMLSTPEAPAPTQSPPPGGSH
jgi:NodT family efflux transporter outer membrane factor (OMF) lipoprotein